MSRSVGPPNFDDFEVQFLNHFHQTYRKNGEDFLEYTPAYRLGYDLALNERLMDRPWELVEREAQEYWEERRPGTWEAYREAAHFAWQQVRLSIRRE